MPLTVRRVLPVLVAALVVAAVPAAASAAPTLSSAPTNPASLAIVYPLTVPPTATGLLDADTLTRYTAPLGLLTRQLDEVIDTPVAIGLDPMILTSIRVLGAAAPVTAADWLDRLTHATNDVFPLAYADADTAISAQAGATEALEPLGFAFAVDPKNFSPPQTDTPTPTPTPTEGTGGTTPVAPPPLPTTDDLLKFDYLTSGIAWPADDTVGKADLPKLKAAGFDTAILSSTNVTTTSALATVGGIRAVVSDNGVSNLLRAATYAADDAALANALDRLVAGLGAVGDGRTVVATIDRHWPFTTMHLRDAVDRISATGAARLLPLAQVLNGAPGTGTIVNKPEKAGRSEIVTRMHADELAEQDFSSVLAEPLALTAPRRLAYLATLAVSWQPDADGWATTTTAFVEQSTQIVSSVQIVNSTSLLALSQSFGLPITVSNALDLPVTVYVTVDPQRPLLQVDGPVKVTVEPNSSNKAYVPAKAITNGEVFVRVSLSSPTGVPVGTPRILKVDLQAAWESIGTVIVVIVLVLIFGGGIVRQVLKRRRSRAARAAPPDPDSGMPTEPVPAESDPDD